MIEARCVAAGINFNDTTWWITGGGPSIDSTEKYDTTLDSTSLNVDLPDVNRYHNLVRINSTHIFLLGGFPYHSDTHYFNQVTEDWTDGPNLVTSREQCSAGLVTFANNSQAIVVVGGRSDRNIEVMFLNENVFRMGPDLTEDVFFGASVPFGNSFLIVGANTDKIYTYDPDVENLVTLPQSLVTSRRITTAFMAPEHYC